MRVLTAFVLSLAAACWSCGGRALTHGEDEPLGSGGSRVDDGVGGSTNGSGGASGGGTPPDMAEIPGPLLTPGECGSGHRPPLWDRLPSCNLTSKSPCRDALGRMVLPPNV